MKNYEILKSCILDLNEYLNEMRGLNDATCDVRTGCLFKFEYKLYKIIEKLEKLTNDVDMEEEQIVLKRENEICHKIIHERETEIEHLKKQRQDFIDSFNKAFHKKN